jgi:hypothetical protein
MNTRITLAFASAVALASSTILAPSALAVSGGASKSWGSFYCSSAYSTQKKNGPVDTTDTLHFSCSVTDKASDGHGVYIQVQGIRSGPIPNTGWKRLTSNASGKGKTEYFGGTFSSSDINDWKLRACLQVANQDDPCTSTLGVDA